MHQIVSGMLVMGYATAGLFFLRFWRQTHDRLFAIFAVAFWVLGLQRLAFALSSLDVEDLTYLFGIRLLAFLLILYAIVDKNLAARRQTKK